MKENIELGLLKTNNDLGLLIIRISVGLLMLLHGIGKLKGIGFIEDMLSAGGLPTFLAYGIYTTEIVAPVLILVGYRTRIAAALYTFGVLFAMLLVHSGDIFTLNQYGGWGVELLGLYFFGGLALCFTGSGKYAVSSTKKWD